MSKAFRLSVQISATIALGLVLLNLLTSPRYPWCMYPIFGLAWWPLSAYFAGRKQPLQFAYAGTALLGALFIFTYLFSSFGAHPWFIYPMLGVFWWPLSVWGAQAGAKRFSITAAETIIASLLLINLLTSPGFWWWLYPALGVIWWPLALHLPDLKHREGESS